MSVPDDLQNRAHALRLYGLLAHWPDVVAEPWLAPLLQWEEDERGRRSLERRIAKPIWATSNRCATSTGPGPGGAIEPSSKS